MALRDDHTLWTWGDNTVGPLGLPAAAHEPARVPGLKPVWRIGAGGFVSMALVDGQ